MNLLPLQQFHHEEFGRPVAALSAQVYTESINSNVWIADWSGSKLADLTATPRTFNANTGQWYLVKGQSKTLSTAAVNAHIEVSNSYEISAAKPGSGILMLGQHAGLNGSVGADPATVYMFVVMPKGQAPPPPGTPPGNGNGNGNGTPPPVGDQTMFWVLGIGTAVVVGLVFLGGRK